MRHLQDRTIDVVRGRANWQDAETIVRFWTENGLLGEAAARARLPEVVCVLRGEAGRIEGVNSVYASGLPLVGGRRFWIYRSSLATPDGDAADAMLNAAFEALDAEFDPDGGGPIGLCVLVESRAERRRRSEAEWTDPRMFYAGYLDDGRQVRIGYFADARISG
jgi:hypothetical protein